MCSASILSARDKDNWDDFVEEHPAGWICHLSCWQEILEQSFSHISNSTLVLKSNESIDAGLPLYTVKSRLTGTRIVSVPFASLCDPLVCDDQGMEYLFAKAQELYASAKASHIELRTFHHADLSIQDRCGVTADYSHHYLKLQDGPDALKKKFDRTCIRQRINRSLKSDITLKIGTDEEDLQKFYSLYVITRKRVLLPPQPYSFIRSLWRMLHPLNMLELLLAEKDGTVIAGMILLKYKNRVSAEYAVSDKNYQQFSPNHFLFWQAINRAFDGGYDIFDFGLTSKNNQTLLDFKKRWGSQVVDVKYYYYPKSEIEGGTSKENSAKYRLIQYLCKISPPFLLRRIGSFCYRHMG